MKIFILCSCFLISFIPKGLTAVEERAGQNVFIQTSFPITVELIPEPADKKGTDVRNIYNIQINCGEGSCVESYGNYWVLLYADDLFMKEFKNPKFPLSLKWNFRGLKAGPHNLKVVVEGPAERLLATQSIALEVIK